MGADLVVMSGNLAMHIIDPGWAATLRGIRGGLVRLTVFAALVIGPAPMLWRSYSPDRR